MTLATAILALAAVAADEPATGFAYVPAAKIRAWLDTSSPVTLLDVREADEYAAGHIADAVNVVYSDVLSLAPKLPGETPIVLYCIHSAHRAQAAARILADAGFKNLYVLEGGITAWHAGGQTILASDASREPRILPKTERCQELEKKSP
jgi:rhodanese-related sulfurtransferase